MPLTQKKIDYGKKLFKYLDEYKKMLVVEVDNVGSHQIQEVRQSLRGKAEILFGKNTMIRKLINDYIEKHGEDAEAKYTPLLSKIVKNIALVFCNGDLKEISDMIKSNRSPAPARAHSLAPNDVIVPAGPTGCDPGQTSFFQALNIATKIQKGQIEIINNVSLIKTGDKVLPGQAVLLEKLNIKPFSYAMVVKYVYDNGSVYEAAVLELAAEDIIKSFLLACQNVASLCLEIGYPTIASIPHSINNTFKLLVGIVANEGFEYQFNEAKPYLDYLADPSKFAVAASAAAPAAGGAEAAKPAEKEESEEETGAVGGLFDDDDY